MKVTNYSKELYGPRRVAHPGEDVDNDDDDDDDDDDDGDEKEDSEVTLSYQLRKRRHH